MNRIDYLQSCKLKRAEKELFALGLRNSGLTHKEIGKRMGLAESTLSDYLKPENHVKHLLKNIEWRVNNREHSRQYAKEWWRKNKREEWRASSIGTIINGKRVIFNGLSKRSYPPDSTCELCRKVSKKLGYHHWNEKNLSLGMWICHSCHRAAEGYEKGIISRYLSLKEKLDKESNAADETANIIIGGSIRCQLPLLAEL